MKTDNHESDDAAQRDVAAAEFPPASEGEHDFSLVMVREKKSVGEGGGGDGCLNAEPTIRNRGQVRGCHRALLSPSV